LPVSERLHHQGLALPLHAGMEIEQVERVAQSVGRLLDDLDANSILRPELSHPRRPGS